MCKCKNCNINDAVKYTNGDFCSSKCVRGYTTKKNRIEINKSVTEKLKCRYVKRFLTDYELKNIKH